MAVFANQQSLENIYFAVSVQTSNCRRHPLVWSLTVPFWNAIWPLTKVVSTRHDRLVPSKGDQPHFDRIICELTV